MSGSEVPSSNDVLRSLRLLRSPDAAERKRGITILAGLHDDPRVQQVFEHLYEQDPDPSVRDAAWRALSQVEPAIPSPAGHDDTPPAASPAPDAPAKAATRPAVQPVQPPTPAASPRREAAPTPVTAQAAVKTAARPAPATTPRPAETKPSASRRKRQAGRSTSAVAPTSAARQARRSRSARHGTRPLFLLNPANTALLAREQARLAAGRKRRGGGVFFFLASLLLLLAIILAAFTVSDWVRWVQFRQDGLDVTGSVTGLDVRGGDYFVQYRYDVLQGGSPATYADEQRVGQDDFAQLAETAPLTVRYLPDDPAISKLALANPDDRTRDGLTIAAGGLVIVSLLLTLVGLARRRRRPVQRGVLTGRLIACEGAPDDDGDYKLRVRFRFRTPTGRVITSHASQIRNDLRQGKLPRIGTPVAVLYRNEQTYKLL